MKTDKLVNLSLIEKILKISGIKSEKELELALDSYLTTNDTHLTDNSCEIVTQGEIIKEFNEDIVKPLKEVYELMDSLGMNKDMKEIEDTIGNVFDETTL